MAKKKSAAPATGVLAGKRVALVGKFGFQDDYRRNYEHKVQRLGGKLVDLANTVPDILVVGEGRGGKPPGEVAKLKKASADMQVLELPDFLRLTLPDRDQLIRQIAQHEVSDPDFWAEIYTTCNQGDIQFDLSNADLGKADFHDAHLEYVVLNGCNLSGANLKFAYFSELENINFDGCSGEHMHLCNVKNSTFRRADLQRAMMFRTAGQHFESCDFTGATLNAARMEQGIFSDCKFAGASLCDLEMKESTFERCDFTGADLSRAHAARAKFDGSTLVKANLSRADFRLSSLRRADLRNANLREAVLTGADLTDANVAGADFQDAVLNDTILKNVDLSKVKNFTPPGVLTPGPKLLELAAAARGSTSFQTSAYVDLGPNEFAQLTVQFSGSSIDARSVYSREGNSSRDRIFATTFDQAMFGLVGRWPKSTLRLDSVEAKGSKTLRGTKLKELAIAAWAELFGAETLDPQELNTQREGQLVEALRDRDALLKEIRKKGAQAWNEMEPRLRRRLDLRAADFSGANLDKISLMGCKLNGAHFAKSSLMRAALSNADLAKADFTNANLERGRLEHTNLTGADFRNANLTNAKLNHARLIGADFTGAILKDADLNKAQFDQTTILPKGFRPPLDMTWTGEGQHPGAKKIKAAMPGSLDFQSFLKQLAKKVDSERLAKAGEMLQAERFQLYAKVADESLIGVVKSQFDQNLVYSCRLASDGDFSCCTQNLRPCGGLRGALCKHLLVLIIGLARAGQLDAATVSHWVDLSRSRRPAIDTEIMSATFLRYKGAEAGEVDWRPTETIPEDFYAM